MPEDKELIDRKRLRRRLSNLEKMCDCPGIDWDELDRVIDTLPIVEAVVLPCKVGDTLYVITQTRDKRILPFINQYEATNIKVGKRKCVVYHEQDGFMKVFKQDDFGKTVFLTREEAEAALTERRNRGEQKAAD